MYVFLVKVAKQVTKEQLFNHLIEQLSTSDAFFGHAVIDEQDEAMMVLMKLLNQDVKTILSTGSELIDPQLVEQSESIVKQRINSLKPMAYILGQVDFAGLTFDIDERALIPRSPIAELIVYGFDQWNDMSQAASALDLCTGSGCIGIALAHHYQHLTVDISDISQQALKLATKNRKIHGLESRVNVIHSDLFNNIEAHYDVILTNPPYVSDDEYKELPVEYKHEPKKGLVTGMDGLRIPVEILFTAPDYLKKNGLLFLEVGYTHELLENAFGAIDFEWIDFSYGGEGVCVFSKEKLLEYRDLFKTYLETKYVI